MLTCEADWLPRKRAVISEVGGSITVSSKRVSGQAFVGRELRDGDIVKITGTAKLNWLAGGTVRFDNPKGNAIIVIGSEKPADRKNVPDYRPSSVKVLKGVVEFLIPSDNDPDLQRDSSGNIIKFGVSTNTIAVGIKGTVFRVGYDEQTQVSTVTVEKGVVAVTPTNPVLSPFDLKAGQEVQVSKTKVGGVKYVNILTANNPVEQFIGCYKDTSAFDLSGYLEHSQMNTPKRCIESCRSRGFEYAAVQYGESCLCGDNYGKYGPATNCNYKCTGDPAQICGGYAANSVYSTGLAGNSSKGCGLGSEWNVVDGFGWNGRWVRRGSSNIFDGAWSKDGLSRVAVLTISINGTSVNVEEQKTGISCNYVGTIAADGKTVTGTYRCSHLPANIYKWNATIMCPN